MRVDDRERIRAVRDDGRRVSIRDRRLADVVDDVRSVRVGGKAGPCLRERAGGGGEVVDLHAVRVERQHCGGRAHAVAVVVVGPDLLGEDRHRVDLVAVGDRERVAGSGNGRRITDDWILDE